MLHQFEIYYANEYLEEIVADLTAALGLTYDEKDVEAASKERDRCSLNNLLIVKREGCLLCIDCNDRDFIMPLVVLCQDSDVAQIKPLMLAWDNKMRQEYYQKLTEEIVDVYNVKDGSTLLSEIESFYHISIYDKFIKQQKIVHQYEMWFTNEYVEELVAVFAEILNLKYDEKDVEIAMEEISMYGIENLLLIKGDGCMLCVDCNYDDYIVPLVVICQEKVADEIRAAMFEWDNKIRKEYGQEPRKEVMNVFYKDNRTLLRRIEEFYKISIHDEYLIYE